MADIFNEIDEDLRRDQLKKIWDRYSTLILAVAFLIVAGVAGWRGYEYWRSVQGQEMGEAYYAAVKLSLDGDHAGAEAAFQRLADKGFAGYPVLAGLRVAGEKALAGDAPGAIIAYDAIASRATTPPLLAGVARIRAAYLAVDVEERAAVDRRASALIDPGNPWRHSAREIQVLTAWKAGDYAAAGKLLEELQNDAEVPREFAARAEILSSLIRAAQGPEKPAAAPAK